MIYLSVILSLFSIFGFAYLFILYKYDNKPLKNKKGLYLKEPIGNAKYIDVDPTHQVLKDVLQSIKIEEWIIDIKIGSFSRYEIEIINPQLTLKVTSRIRYDRSSSRNTKDEIYLSSFNIITLNGSSRSTLISYDDENELPKYLILNHLWDYILKYHQDIHDNDIKHYMNVKQLISKELKTLNRDRILNNIL